MTTTTGSEGAPLDREGSVTVVGASLAGLRAVSALRAEGFVGRLVLIGEEPHLPYDRPPLSKQLLAGQWEPERIQLTKPGALEEMGVELLLGHRAVRLDAGACRVELDDGGVIESDAVVVATGASPRVLPGMPEHEAVTVLRTIENALALRRRIEELGAGCRVVVIGAGFIGSEVASTCVGLGCHVTVIEALPTPLEPALGETMGAACAALHADAGVELRTGVGVQAVVAGETESAWRPASPAEVQLADGTLVPADVVVVGIGVVPSVGWLADSGLVVSNGVVCDRALFAADRVVAAGDLARWHWEHDGHSEEVRIEHWQLAAEEGMHAAASLLAGRRAAAPFVPVPYFWSDQYGVKIQMLGRPDPDDEVTVVEGAVEERKFVALYGRKGRLTAALAMSQPRQLMAYRSVLAEGASYDDALASARDR
jgi:3-phenylpropionate/trans-cinnamate dioxygenase ferredoxin reductase subunit